MADQLAIFWDSERLSVAEIRADRSAIALLNACTVDAPTESIGPSDAANWGRALQERLKSSGIHSKKVQFVFPRELAVTRLLELPETPDEELGELVRLQAATRAGLPPEQLVLDFLPLPKLTGDDGQRVLTFTIDASRLKACREMVAAAELELQGVSVTSLLTAEAVARLSFTGTNPVLLVHQRGSQLEVALLEHGQVVFSHSTRVPDGDDLRPLTAEFARVTVSLDRIHPGLELAKVVFVCETTSSATNESASQLMLSGEGVREVLAKQFRDKLMSLHPTTEFAPNIRDLERHPSLPFVLIGAAFAQSNFCTPQINFIASRTEKRTRKLVIPKWVWLATAAAILLLIGYYLNVSYLNDLNTQIANAKTKKQSLDEALKRGQPITESHQLITGWMDASESPTTCWEHLQNLLPNTDRIYFTSVKLLPVSGNAVMRIRANGAAHQRKDVNELEHILAEKGFQLKPQAVSVNRKDPDYPYVFELDAEMLRVIPSKTNAPAQGTVAKPPKLNGSEKS